MKIHIPIKCSTCKWYATGEADGENSLDKEAIKTALCTRHITYDVVCPKPYRKKGCEHYHLNWDIYNKLMSATTALPVKCGSQSRAINAVDNYIEETADTGQMDEFLISPQGRTYIEHTK